MPVTRGGYGRAPNQAYQSALYAAQDEESTESLMQEMWCREGNVGTNSKGMPGKNFGKKISRYKTGNKNMFHVPL